METSSFFPEIILTIFGLGALIASLVFHFELSKTTHPYMVYLENNNPHDKGMVYGIATMFVLSVFFLLSDAGLLFPTASGQETLQCIIVLDTILYIAVWAFAQKLTFQKV